MKYEAFMWSSGCWQKKCLFFLHRFCKMELEFEYIILGISVHVSGIHEQTHNVY